MRQLLAVLAIGFGLAASLPATDLLPLEMGSYWVYQDEKSGESFTIRVGQPVATQDGRVYHYLTGYAGKYVIARVDEAGNLVVLDDQTGGETILTAFGARSGHWWDAPFRDCPQQGQTQEKYIDYSGPAGRWSRVVDVHYRASGCADTGVASEQFAANIGMLRRVVTTIAGPRTFDLVYARVGNQIIETRDRARFSVSVDQPLARNILRVTLRVDIGYTPQLRLRFPSAQEFDVALRDPDGKVVWLWSEGRFFEQSVQEKGIGNLWNAVVEVPRPPGDMVGYTIEGWLTTAPGEPRFAATAPAPPPRVVQ